jgi:hypothetical protein
MRPRGLQCAIDQNIRPGKEVANRRRSRQWPDRARWTEKHDSSRTFWARCLPLVTRQGWAQSIYLRIPRAPTTVSDYALHYTLLCPGDDGASHEIRIVLGKGVMHFLRDVPFRWGKSLG